MHAERLFSIVEQIIESYNTYDIIGHFDRLIGSVNSRISNPSDRQFDEQISINSRHLIGALNDSDMNYFPVTWRKLMQELALDELLPEMVRFEIEQAFSNRIVDSDLLNALQKTKKQLNNKIKAITALRDGFTAVGIKDDQLKPAEVEFDVMMPRQSINDQLVGFNKELSQLNKGLTVIASVTKSPEQLFKINSVSTNDFTVALNIDINLGEILTTILLGLAIIRNSYQSKVDIIVAGLKDLPEKLFADFKEWANSHVETEIAKLIERLPKECPHSIDLENLEKNKGLLRDALRYLAECHERGFNMDVRAGISDTESDNTEENNASDAQLVTTISRLKAIAQKAGDLKIIARQTDPILEITQKSNENDS